MQTGRCNCNKISYTVTGEPLKTLGCACVPCMKISGNPFGVIATLYDRAQIDLHDPHQLLKTYLNNDTQSGKPKHDMFCSECGVMLFAWCSGSNGDTWDVYNTTIDGWQQLDQPVESYLFPNGLQNKLVNSILSYMKRD